MNRRKFIQQGLATTGAAAIAGQALAAQKSTGYFPATGRILNGYYFRAHMYTLVPRHVREDMKWMADIGTSVVSVAVLEQDLFAAVENIQIIVEEAKRLGMNVFAVPSRWGGLLAGAPKVPSLFAVLNPQTWMLQPDGKPYQNANSGVTCSIHYPETYDFFCKSADSIAGIGGISGIIWDEPKNFATRDFSPKAREVLGTDASAEQHAAAMAGFYSRVNTYIKGKYPDMALSMFVYANTKDMVIEKAAAIEQMDYFGCDGRPWAQADGGKLESEGKVLLGPGEKFITAARKHGKKALLLIENHNMTSAEIPLMDRGLPKVMALGAEQLIYYYYPRNIQEPDKNMATIARHLKKYRR
jgi:hypothetical protein